MGSFPQFGYQARRSAGKRALAQANSAATHGRKKAYELQCELKFVELMMQLWLENLPKTGTAEEQKWWKKNEAKLIKFSNSMKDGKRVYWKRLGKLLRDFNEKIDIGLTNDVQAEAKSHFGGDVSKWYAEAAETLVGLNLKVAQGKLAQG